jgi:hypothetical protein
MNQKLRQDKNRVNNVEPKSDYGNLALLRTKLSSMNDNNLRKNSIKFINIFKLTDMVLENPRTTNLHFC